MEDDKNLFNPSQEKTEYIDDNIITLSGIEHIRLRPGMYIGR